MTRVYLCFALISLFSNSILSASGTCRCTGIPGNYPGVVAFHASQWGTSGIGVFPAFEAGKEELNFERAQEACLEFVKLMQDLKVCE